MSRLLPTLLLSALILCSSPGGAAASPGAQPIAAAPAPSWVAEAAVDYAAPASDDAVSTFVLLDDEQHRAAGRRSAVYYRSATRILTREGVDMASAVMAFFDPSYQQLGVHYVRVIRDGQVREVFEPRAMRLEAVATSSDARTYSGRERATFLIPDLRVGDVIDVAYTISGANPVFGDHAIGTLVLSGGFPAAKRSARVLVEAGTPLLLDVADGINYTTGRVGAFDEHRFERLAVPALEYDGRQPAWRDQVYTVRYSDFGTWDAVALWASQLFRPATASDAAIRALAADIRAQHPLERDRLRAALRFVQDDIRYVAISMGESSHRPHPAAEVAAQRFGDCKDKSVLLVSLLDELGIEATPALVSTTEGPVLDEQVPSPFAFDHVIVRARIMGPRGLEELWLDPTEAGVRGDVLPPPPFHRGLLTVALAGGLRAIPFPALVEPAVDVTETFEVGAPGQPTTLTVVTVMRGPEANTLRRRLGWQSRDDLADEWRKLYADHFADLETTVPLEVEDDEEANTITVRERYRTSTFWVEGLRDLYVREVTASMYRPEDERPPGPLALRHPVDVRHTVRLRQESDPLRFEPDHHWIDNAYFSYDFDARREGKTFVIKANYRSKAEEVAAEDVAAYTAAVDEALEHSTYSLQWYGLTLPDLHINWWLMGVVTLVLLGGIAWWTVRTLRAPAPTVRVWPTPVMTDPYRTAAPPPPPRRDYDIELPPPSNGDATAAMVLGICGFLMCLIPFLGPMTCIVAIYWSRRGTVRSWELHGSGRGQAIAGLVLGLTGLAIIAITSLLGDLRV